MCVCVCVCVSRCIATRALLRIPQAAGGASTLLVLRLKSTHGDGCPIPWLRGYAPARVHPNPILTPSSSLFLGGRRGQHAAGAAWLPHPMAALLIGFTLTLS